MNQSGCTDKIATWDENSGKFTVDYDDTANTMTIRMTDTGLSEINEAATVYTNSVKRGYSDCTMRITYAATLTADAKMGDTDNPNEVVLTWKRTNTTYFDTLKDCCHVYTYGIDVLKQFSDNGGNVRNVKFRLHNDTDDVFVIADLKDGVYYAKGFAAKKADAKGDGTEENWSYHLNAAEQEVLARKMEAFCQQQNDMCLHDFARQLQEEPGPSPQIQM